MKYNFREPAMEWLRAKDFSDVEIEELREVLSRMMERHGNDTIVKIPKNASRRVSAIAFLLSSITNEKGEMTCIDGSGLISIPEEAQSSFGDSIKLQELEDNTTTGSKAKFGRDHSSPKRRGSGKSERY